MLTGQHIRDACALLGWSRYDLQPQTALPLVIVDILLGSVGALNGTLADEIILKEAFHRAGVEFIPENGGEAGVRLRKADKGEAI